MMQNAESLFAEAAVGLRFSRAYTQVFAQHETFRHVSVDRYGAVIVHSCYEFPSPRRITVDFKIGELL